VASLKKAMEIKWGWRCWFNALELLSGRIDHDQENGNCSGERCFHDFDRIRADGAGQNRKASGDWAVIARDDGKKMWAYKGRPLYTWKNDKAPGDTDGDGKLNGAWHVAVP
jgi:predicted lipoprotein with Yx(FWY)xxD motif